MAQSADEDRADAGPTSAITNEPITLDESVRGGDEELLRHLLDNVAIIEHRPIDELNSLLRKAATFGDAAAIELLLSAGADINDRESDSEQSVLHHAIASARTHPNLSAIRSLLVRGAEVEAQDRQGRTPLILAIANQSREVVELLLTEGGASVDGAYDLGETPLIVALDKADAQLVSLLLDSGAGVDIPDDEFEGPLCKAILKFEDEEERYRVCLALLDRGAQIDSSDGDSRTMALHLALDRRGDVRLAELLVARGANLYSRDDDERTPLQLAVKLNFVDFARKLLEAGASPHDEPRSEESVLKEAVKAGKEEMLALLLRYDADWKDDPEAESVGASMLRHAVNLRKRAVAQYLLENGVDVNLEVDGRLPLIGVQKEFDTYRRDKSKSMAYLLLRHIALRAARDMHINEKNMKLIEEDADVSSEYESYRRELEDMKSAICDEYSVTYFDVLTKRDDELMRCLSCEAARDALSSGDHLKRFPIFADQISQNYAKGLKRLQSAENS